MVLIYQIKSKLDVMQRYLQDTVFRILRMFKIRSLVLAADKACLRVYLVNSPWIFETYGGAYLGY